MKLFQLRNMLLVPLFALMVTSIGWGQNQNENDRRERRKPPTFKQLLKDMDANEDGKLSKKEVKGPLKDHFDKVDANEDGFITKKEFDEAPRPKRRPDNN